MMYFFCFLTGIATSLAYHFALLETAKRGTKQTDFIISFLIRLCILSFIFYLILRQGDFIALLVAFVSFMLTRLVFVYIVKKNLRQISDQRKKIRAQKKKSERGKKKKS